MKPTYRPLAYLALAAAMLLWSSYPASAAQLLPGHLPQAVAESSPAGAMPRSDRLTLSVGLPLRNSGELNDWLQQVVEPASPNYRKYLTAAEFTERFGPTEEDYQALSAFFRARGFAVSGTYANRMVLDVRGNAAAIEATFHVHMLLWQHPQRGVFYAPDREPSIDSDVPILHVEGLDNFALPHPMDLKWRALSSAHPLTSGSGPYGLYIGGDFRAAYAPGVALNGSGQSVGLFELDGFYAGDVVSNFQQAGLPPVPVKTVLLDGFSGTPGSANTEVILDIMMAAYMAPGASQVIVYEGTNWDDVLNRMASDNLAAQLSSSWCFYPTDATTEQIFKEMIAQGQSLFQASGDSGAYGGWIMPPADDPNVTVVGGTSLTTAGAGGPWQSETAWSGSGGGVSTTWPIPSYQQAVNMPAAGGSATMRNIPDVAMLADIQIFLIQSNGQAIEVGGTSAAAPLWAGFLALANQQAAGGAKPAVGFLNPVIYSIGSGSSYKSDLHDITGGNTGFPALAGYDLTTGWGTPAGQDLIDDLTGIANPAAFSLSASPFTLSTAPGGSATATVTVAPQNGFSGSVALSATGLPTGVTAAFSPATATTSSTLTLSASSSAAGSTSTITVTGVSGNLVSTAKLVFTVAAPASFAMTAAPASISLGQGNTATSTITVTPQNGFSGSVALAASGLPKGVTASFSPASTAGTSTLTLAAASSATLGAATVIITGTSGSLHATASISLAVTAPVRSYTITASPASLSVLQGGSGTSTITVVPQNGFTGSVALTVSGLPTGVTGSFSPASTTKTSTLTLKATATATIGAATVTVTATSGSLSSKAAITLTVAAPPSFTLSSSPATLTLVPGAKVTSTISVGALNGFASSVTLSATGLPSGVTASFSASSTKTTSTLTLTATTSAATGAATVTVTGTAGSLSAKATIALTVTAPPSFTLTATPASLSVSPGANSAGTIAITGQNGFSGSVSLTAAGVPSGVTAAFSPSSATASAAVIFTAAKTAASAKATITITGTSGSLTAKTTVSLTVAPSAAGASTAVSLASVYNVSGIVTDGATFTSGGLDGGGRAYSASLLGTQQTVNGTSYTLGLPNAPDAVSSVTVPLPAGQFSTLKLLATAVNGNQTAQTFTVTYNDGSTTAFTQSLSDWCTPQSYPGESNAVPMTYRDNSTGTRDTRSMELYGYSLTLSSAKTVSSITLPKNRNVVVLAISLSAAAASTSPAQVSLAAVFDTAGMVTDGHIFSGGIDGVGNAYSATLLGTTVTFNQVLFDLGPANSPNVVSGTGKAVTLPAGKFSTLAMLASGVNGNQAAKAFQVTYSDGTSSTFTQSLSDWYTPQNYAGESAAVTMAHRDVSNGSTDNRTFHVYAYTFALNNNKTVSSITLPADTNVKVLALTLTP